jgi:hypothetical protein
MTSERDQTVISPHFWQPAGCGVRAHACRVETLLDTRLGRRQGASAKARRGACATLNAG